MRPYKEVLHVSGLWNQTILCSNPHLSCNPGQIIQLLKNKCLIYKVGIIYTYFTELLGGLVANTNVES